MNKRRITISGGRYLIYFTFPENRVERRGARGLSQGFAPSRQGLASGSSPEEESKTRSDRESK